MVGCFHPPGYPLSPTAGLSALICEKKKVAIWSQAVCQCDECGKPTVNDFYLCLWQSKVNGKLRCAFSLFPSSIIKMKYPILSTVSGISVTSDARRKNEQTEKARNIRKNQIVRQPILIILFEIGCRTNLPALTAHDKIKRI